MDLQIYGCAILQDFYDSFEFYSKAGQLKERNYVSKHKNGAGICLVYARQNLNSAIRK